MSNNESLCWYCLHAVPRTNNNGVYICGCEWSRFKAPVKNWEASLESNNQGMTFNVRYCPKYKNDILPDLPMKAAERLALYNWNKYGVQIFPGSRIGGIGVRAKHGSLTPEERRKRNLESHKRWRARHPDYDRKKRMEQYHAKHPDARYYRKLTPAQQKLDAKEKARIWRAEHPNYFREYYYTHKDEILAKRKEKRRNDALRNQQRNSGLPAD